MTPRRRAPKDSIDVLLEIAGAGTPIQGVRTGVIGGAKALQERIGGGRRSAALVERALRARDRCGVPFWDLLLLKAGRSPDARHVVEAAGYHLSNRSVGTEVCAHELSREGVLADCGGLKRGQMLVAFSDVRMSEGVTLHIPMLDFHCRPSPTNLRLVAAVVRSLGGSGYVVLSGRSYHYWGRRLLTDSGLIEFLGSALLYSPVTDRRWIAHQLIERRCALRISARSRNGPLPQVVAEV